MRLWSIHPSYLDTKGLVALWREGLLAQAVLLGKTTGYRHHPQLIRFYNHPTPVQAIAYYLSIVHEESEKRGYAFNSAKISSYQPPVRIIPVTSGQLDFEIFHLHLKLLLRDYQWLNQIDASIAIVPHPLFTVVPGEIEAWERMKS